MAKGSGADHKAIVFRSRLPISQGSSQVMKSRYFPTFLKTSSPRQTQLLQNVNFFPKIFLNFIPIGKVYIFIMWTSSNKRSIQNQNYLPNS